MDIEDNRRRKKTAGILNLKFVKRLKCVKNIELIAAVFIIAVALVIYSSVTAARSSEQSDSTMVSATESMNDDERRLASVLAEIKGAGDVSVMISEDADGNITGVLVVAEGAGDIGVMLKLSDAAATALGVDKRMVNVYVKT